MKSDITIKLSHGFKKKVHALIFTTILLFLSWTQLVVNLNSEVNKKEAFKTRNFRTAKFQDSYDEILQFIEQQNVILSSLQHNCGSTRNFDVKYYLPDLSTYDSFLLNMDYHMQVMQVMQVISPKR